MAFIGDSFITRARRALTLGAIFLASGANAFAQEPGLDSMVRKALRDGRDIPVIVQFKNDEALKRGKALKSGKVEFKREVKALRALGMKVNNRALRELLATPGVEHISYDAPVQGNQLLSTTSTTTGVSADASGSRVARERYKVNGAGVTVAVIDSGVQPHTDLPSSRIRGFVDFVNGRTTPYDDYGHGTHVAGVVAGSGSASSGKWAGVAPGASIVGLKVLDASGAGSTSNVLAALEWVLTNHATYGIRVVNLSLGHPIYEAAATDPLVQMVNRVSQRGIVVVVAAGNMGRSPLGQTVYGSITSPANAQGAIAVGATETLYTLPRSDDKIASFSSRGPTRYDYYVKPDVVAPGHHIVSLLSPNSTLATKYPELRVSTSYFRLNGTSMAAPVVAGQVALLLQANPKLSANTAKGVVQFTAERMRNIDVMSQGAGQVNVPGSVRLASLVHTAQSYEKRWIKGSRKPVGVDLMFGETSYWGRALIYNGTLKSNSAAFYVHLAQWSDNIVWGYLFDNIVWSAWTDNIVWSMLLDNIVWSLAEENLVWGLTDDNIVWGFDDSAVSGFDNIVWSSDNIVWSMDTDSVLAFSTEEIMGLSFGAEDQEQGTLPEGQ